jgi:hypothetical protein
MTNYEENIPGGEAQGAQWEATNERDRVGPGGDRRYEDTQGPGYGRSVERKSVAAAAVLSCLPGLGQVYAGYYQRGFTHIAVVAGLILLLNQSQLWTIHPFIGVFLPFYWIYNIIDASRCAQIANRIARGDAPADIAGPLPMPGQFGGTVTGIFFIGLGFLLLMVTKFDMDLRWLGEWWPVILIVIGGNLLFRSRSSRD